MGRARRVERDRDDLARFLNVAAEKATLRSVWGATGLFAGVGLQSFLNVDGLVFSCGSLTVAIGMALLQITTLSEDGRNLFYEGIKPHEDYLNLGIVLLWGGGR